MTRLLDILEDYCLFRGYQYCRIDGNTSGADSETILGLGRCHSLGELVARSFKGLRKTIRKESEKHFE